MSSTESLSRQPINHSGDDASAGHYTRTSNSGKNRKSWSFKRKAWTFLAVIIAIVIIVVAVVVPVVLTRKNSRRIPKTYEQLYFPQGYSGTGINGYVRGKRQNTTYDQLVVFGSSYSDNAHPRAAQYSGSLAGEGYWEGRWSDGPIWVEYLRDILGPNVTHLNYAYGGATTNNSIHLAGSPDTGIQVQNHLREHPPSNSKPLVATFTTTNDITATFRNYVDPSNPIYNNLTAALLEIQESARLFITQLASLIPLANSSSAAAPDYLILPILPVELAPQSRSLAASGGSSTDVIRQITDKYNEGLMVGAEYLATRLFNAGRVITYDVPAWYYAMVDNPRDYNLTQIRNGCLTTQNCNDASGYLWWDHLHLPTHMQKKLARLSANVIYNQTVMP